MKRIRLNTALVLALTLAMALSSSCDSGSSTLPPPTIIGNNGGTGGGNGGGGNNGGGSTEVDMTPIYDYIRTYQLAFIRSLQLPSGALKDNEASNSKITPYFANFAAMALLTDPTEQNLEAVRKWMSWYFSKLNSAAEDSNTEGSIYDYFAPNETTNRTYDSVDSYAATFLELSLRFAGISDECKTWLGQHKSELSLIAKAMLKTIDTPKNAIPSGDENDYLSIAHYGYSVKYLMDNSEVNMGLRAARALQNAGLLDTTENLADLISRNSTSIKALWNNSKGNYDYAKDNPSSWNEFYPGATCQLYPCLFGAVSPLDAKSRMVYEKFNATYPEWHTGYSYTTFPWTMIVYAAAVMNDKERVDAYITHIYGINVKNEQKTNWYDAEAGALLLAIDVIRKSNAD